MPHVYAELAEAPTNERIAKAANTRNGSIP
jgi:hypothetical protein